MRLTLGSGTKDHHGHGVKSRSSRLTGLRNLLSFRPAPLTPSGRRVAIFVAGLMLVTLCLGDRGLIKLVGLLRDRAAVRAELVRLETHHTELEAEYRRYTTDPATIEKVARESLDWVRRGETVYKFPSK